MMLLAIANKDDDLSFLNDKLHMDDQGLPIRFGMTSQFMFNSYGKLEDRETTVRLAEDYYHAALPHPNVLVQEEDVFTLKSVSDIRRRLTTSRADDGTVGDLGDEMADPERTLSFYIKHQAQGDNALVPGYRKFSCLIDGRNYRRSGSLTYTNRYSELLGKQDAFIDDFKRACEGLNVFYAVAGCSLLVFTYTNARMHTMYPLYRRFPGLLYADSGGLTSDTQRRDDVIRDVNWLTAINDANVTRLGGLEAVRERLSANIVLHPYNGGVVFQAGPKPRMGDVNHGDVPGAYKEINAALKPLRFQDYTAPYYLPVPDDVSRREATEAWISRFD